MGRKKDLLLGPNWTGLPHDTNGHFDVVRSSFGQTDSIIRLVDDKKSKSGFPRVEVPHSTPLPKRLHAPVPYQLTLPYPMLAGTYCMRPD